MGVTYRTATSVLLRPRLLPPFPACSCCRPGVFASVRLAAAGAWYSASSGLPSADKR
jgi:hypothetical protein